MIDFDWDIVERVAKETGRAVMVGVWSDFTIRDKREMSEEARKRNLSLTFGNSRRDPDEKDDELYVMAKL